ncbi:MAG: diadenylate cyclase CdaA [Candidatus Aminicenantaceae bacterium]
MFADTVNALTRFTVVDLVDILLVTFILYSFFLLIKDTKAYQMAIGFGIVVILFLITQWGKLVVANSLIKIFILYLPIAIIVLFQGELRRLFTELGSRSFKRSFSTKSFQEKLEDLFLAVDYLSSKKIGALIAIEKEISLKSYADRGMKIDAVLSKDLLVSIFFPRSPLHDGAVIIKGNKVLAAGCLLPLPSSHKLGEEFMPRTRHLAAIGLSQETDAAVIVVSEETGSVSLAVKGNLERDLNKANLKELLLEYMKKR